MVYTNWIREGGGIGFVLIEKKIVIPEVTDRERRHTIYEAMQIKPSKMYLDAREFFIRCRHHFVITRSNIPDYAFLHESTIKAQTKISHG